MFFFSSVWKRDIERERREKGSRRKREHIEAVNCTNFCCLLEKAEVVTSLVVRFSLFLQRGAYYQRGSGSLSEVLTDIKVLFKIAQGTTTDISGVKSHSSNFLDG